MQRTSLATAVLVVGLLMVIESQSRETYALRLGEQTTFAGEGNQRYKGMLLNNIIHELFALLYGRQSNLSAVYFAQKPKLFKNNVRPTYMGLPWNKNMACPRIGLENVDNADDSQVEILPNFVDQNATNCPDIADNEAENTDTYQVVSGNTIETRVGVEGEKNSSSFTGLSVRHVVFENQSARQKSIESGLAVAIFPITVEGSTSTDSGCKEYWFLKCCSLVQSVPCMATYGFGYRPTNYSWINCSHGSVNELETNATVWEAVYSCTANDCNPLDLLYKWNINCLRCKPEQSCAAIDRNKTTIDKGPKPILPCQKLSADKLECCRTNNGTMSDSCFDFGDYCGFENRQSDFVQQAVPDFPNKTAATGISKPAATLSSAIPAINTNYTTPELAAQERMALLLESSRELLSSVFHQIDTNDNSFITIGELLNWLENIEYSCKNNSIKLFWMRFNGEIKPTLTWQDYSMHIYGYCKTIDSLLAGGSNLNTIESLMLRDYHRWSLADANNDNELTREEFTMFLRVDAYQKLREVIVDQIMFLLDMDNNDLITLDEYIIQMYADSTNFRANDYNFMKLYDANADESISREELTNALDLYDNEQFHQHAVPFLKLSQRSNPDQLKYKEMFNKFLFTVRTTAAIE